LKGDQLIVISEMGMRTWFRDTFIDLFNTQKLGGYDPYLNEYVLSINDDPLPQEADCINCGIQQTFTIAAGNSVSYCVDLNQPVGNATVLYSVPPSSTANFEVEVTYNAVTVSSGVVSTSGSLVFNKSSNSVNVATVTITATNNVVITVNPKCPTTSNLTVVRVTLTSVVDSGKFIHNEYRYTDGPFISPVQSTLVTFATGASSPIVSQFTSVTGAEGTSGIPTSGSSVQMIYNKIGFDNFNFDISSDKFRYLRSNTVYGNNPVDIAALVAASTNVTPVTGSGSFYSGAFTVPSGGQYLYLIWDYRNSLPLQLCYSNINEFDACCEC